MQKKKQLKADGLPTDSIRMAQIYCNNGKPLISKKALPNDPCSCGSGKKSKKCCGTGTKYFQMN